LTKGEGTNGPWSDLSADGANLSVHDFVTKRISQVMSALRRNVTLPYARSFGLSISEWRILSLVAHAGVIAFSELVVQSTSDKAMVSRVVRALEKRGLVTTRPETESSRKRIACEVTEAGAALYARAIVVAKRQQAEVLLMLSVEERGQLHRILEKLQTHLDHAAPDIPLSAGDSDLD